MPASVPNIVASGNYVAQTSPLSQLTLYTPSASGLFRLNLYWQYTNDISFVFGWTDASHGAQSTSGTAGSPTMGNAYSYVLPFQAEGSTDFTLEVDINIAGTWSLYYTIEQLQ